MKQTLRRICNSRIPLSIIHVPEPVINHIQTPTMRVAPAACPNAMSEALNARIKLSVANLTVITEKSFPTSGRKPLHASPLNFYWPIIFLHNAK